MEISCTNAITADTYAWLAMARYVESVLKMQVLRFKIVRLLTITKKLQFPD